MSNLFQGVGRRNLLWDILLVYVLLAGAALRLAGVDWGEYQYLHPDERFLVWVGSDIQLPGTGEERLGPPPTVETKPERAAWPQLRDCQEWGGYFDAACSPLNPNNRGHGFYVYGTLPMFITRTLVEWIYGHSGFEEMTDVGRPLSALADLLTVYLVYLIAARLYGKKVGLLAAAFNALTVLQIQLSHYYAVDTFQNFFTYLAMYFAVRVMQTPAEGAAKPGRLLATLKLPPAVERFVVHPFFAFSAAFGAALGFAAASKLSAAPAAALLPAAFALAVWRAPAKEQGKQALHALFYLSLAALVSLLVFRLFQPYAFLGPGFFGLRPNPQWVSNIREQRIQAGGDVDFPPALQWARRPLWFSGQNLTVWGLGLPLGLLAWAGFAWAAWRMVADRSKRRFAWGRHALLWAWTGLYFAWQSLAFNPTMRYQLPVYPALAIFAAWGVSRLWRQAAETEGRRKSAWRAAALFTGGGVLLASAAWAWAFTQIYLRPTTRIEASRWIYQNVPGAVNLRIESGESSFSQPLPFPQGATLSVGGAQWLGFTPKEDGLLTAISLAHVVDLESNPAPKRLSLRVEGPEGTASAALTSNFNASGDSRGGAYTAQFSTPFPVVEGVQYRLALELAGESATLSFAGAAPANESTWDDGLPLRVEGYDGYGGIYTPGLNFEMYWEDNPDKFERFVSTLDQADYIFISSNRQWGTTTRVPERYPLTSEYYRRLLGCPVERSVEWCYRVAQTGDFQGDLGFDLVQVFDSSPRLGSLRFNTQFAEEAFTVYDHPKVFIFQKRADYDPQRVRQILGAVDLSQVVHVTPKKTRSSPANLLLPLQRWAEQQAGGSWTDFFSYDALQNRYPALGAALWYLSLALLGWAVYPLLRLAFPGLPDRGYPLARIAGMLLLAWLVWIAGSARIPFTRVTIAAALSVIALLGGLAATLQRGELAQEWRSRRRYLLIVEALFLAFFVLDLLIRLGNPDLWHPWKGGEKPMDFAYFNAVLKSTSFPPYDPWYAGGYLNYYYYGFLISGALVKGLGIVPSIAYNLILPTMFALIALGAFSLGWNLFYRPPAEEAVRPAVSPYLPAAGAAMGMALLGNLGMARMIFQGYQRLAAPDGVIEGAALLTRWGWALKGALMAFTGDALPYALGDWYWIPSRVIPAPGDVEPITEFPFFTVIYGDPHAHLFALPITLLAISFALALVLGRKRPAGALSRATLFALGGLAIGALKPTNTWDFYTFLVMGCVAVLYAASEAPLAAGKGWLGGLSVASRRVLLALGGAALLTALASLLYKPYSDWFALGYTKVNLWTGTHTTLSAYLTHWGLFLFVIVSWMSWETRQWMAQTPVSALRKLAPHKNFLWMLLLLGLAVIAAVTVVWKVKIAWFVLLLAAWALILLLRPGMSAARRFTLFLTGTGLILTLTVEVVVLAGDIGRMNTVFKFYLQVWTLFAVSAAAALGWLLEEISQWRPRWRSAWQLALTALLFAAALYPLLGGMAKIKDRMEPRAAHTLDGMAYMQKATYADSWGTMDLSQDYRAIRWMQENVSGSPVIVEANLRDLYRWGSRFSIYTGLPGVVGWEWHQQQQRAVFSGAQVSERIAEVDNFYATSDLGAARDFLRKYNVRYIILGQQERGHYAKEQYQFGAGLAKFPLAEGALWRAVYQDGDTIIYETLGD
jgi:YYY domain-containing protein